MKGCRVILYLLLLINRTAFGQSPELAKSFTGHTQTIMALAGSNNGEFLLSGSDDDLAYLWNDQG
jgi:WD40 repeat protein